MEILMMKIVQFLMIKEVVAILVNLLKMEH